MMRGGNKAREFNNYNEDIDTKSDNILSRGPKIDQCSELPPVNPFILPDYNFVCDHGDTQKNSGVNESLEEEERYMSEVINGS